MSGSLTQPPPPATRVGRHVLLPGGHVMRLSRWRQFLFATGLRKSLFNTNERS